MKRAVPSRQWRHPNPERRTGQDVLQRPGTILYHGDLLCSERLAGLDVLDVQQTGHHPVIPDPCPDPFHSGQGIGLGHQATAGILCIHKPASPAIHVNLYPLPGDIQHTAPDIDLAIRPEIEGQAPHRLQVVVVRPGPVGIVHAGQIKQVLVIVQC